MPLFSGRKMSTSVLFRCAHRAASRVLPPRRHLCPSGTISASASSSASNIVWSRVLAGSGKHVENLPSCRGRSITGFRLAPGFESQRIGSDSPAVAGGSGCGGMSPGARVQVSAVLGEAAALGLTYITPPETGCRHIQPASALHIVCSGVKYISPAAFARHVADMFESTHLLSRRRDRPAAGELGRSAAPPPAQSCRAAAMPSQQPARHSTTLSATFIPALACSPC